MQFQWSKKKYTLRDLIAQCKDTLPVIISVAEGYTGSDGDDTHDIAAGSVFFVFAVEVQSRIVALTEDERYLSMSRSCPVNFHIIHKDRSLSEPYRLDDIVLHENNNLGDLRIQMAAPEDGGLGPMDAGSSDIQGTLRVLDLYDERYMLCHSFIEDSFCETTVVSIPSYLPIAVVFATGCKNGSQADFKEFLNQVNATALKSQQEYANQPRNAEEIVVFSDPPNGDYEYIESTATAASRVSRSPSFKIVDTTRSPERELTLQWKETSTTETYTTTTTDAARHEGEQLALTVPRLPPRNTPRRSSPVGRPKLEEKVVDSRVTWTTPSRRPLPPLPDLIGRGSSSVTEERWGGDERVIANRKPEEVNRLTIPPLKKESLFQRGTSSPSHSPKFSSKFGKDRPRLDEVSSDSEALQRDRTTGNASRTKASSSTSGKKPEVQKTNQSATWSPWPFTSLKRNVEKSKLQKSRPPIPKKPTVLPTVTKFQTLTSRNSTGTFKELDESFLDVSQNSAQRPGTLTLGGQLDSSSGYDGDFESYYDEIKSPMTRNRLSGVADDDKSNGTEEDTPQWESESIPSRLDGLSLRSTDTTGRLSDTESGELDSSYEEISLPSPSSRTTSETTSDSGISSAPTNVSTPTLLLHSGVHNFINVKRDLLQQQPSRKDIRDARLVFTESLNQVCRPPPSLQTFKQTWRSADNLPLDIVSLSVEQVSACLTVLNLGQYVRTFREQQIDGALLSCLDKDVLVSDFGFRKFDAIKLAKFARDGWRPKVDEEDTHC